MAPKRKITKSNISNFPKKSKTESANLDVSQIKALAKSISDSSAYNEIPKLILQYASIKATLLAQQNDEIETVGRQLTVSLYQVFTALFQSGLLRPSKKYDEKKLILVKWLIDKYDKFKDILFDFIRVKLSFKSSLQLDIIDIVLKLLKLEHEYLKSSKDDLYFPNTTYKAFIKSLANSEETEVTDGFLDNFLVLHFKEKCSKYYDLQFYLFQSLNELITSGEIEKSKTFVLYYTLVNDPTKFVDDKNELKTVKTFIPKPPKSIFKPLNFKKVFQELLINILEFNLNSSQYKSLLLILNKRILPHLSQPSRLMDFLTDSYDNSDLIAQILALNSLWELMKQYNLEYPDFFTKLYSLLTPSLLYSRYRSRFFRLSDLFLSSTHLSSNLVASFIKRLCRLSITGPAPGVVIIIPFIYNLLKRHPSCMIMIQNSEVPEDYQDPFDVEEINPLKTNAINSSLWELEALMNHYHPNISTLAKIYNEPFRKPNYKMEDFLDWSYKSLLESEKNRKYKMAALEFDTWDHLFDPVSKDTYLESESVYLPGWTLI